MVKYFLLLVVVLGVTRVAAADCYIQPPKKKTTFIVKSCRMVDPQKEAAVRTFVARYVQAFTARPEEYRRHAEAVAETYRGALLTVELNGQQRQLFDKGRQDHCPPADPVPVMTTYIYRACCDGDANMPCLLDTEEYIDSRTIDEFKESCGRTSGIFMDCATAFAEGCARAEKIENRDVICSCPEGQGWSDRDGCK